MTNHTPGPWAYEPQAYHPDRIFAGCKLIATAHGDSAETEANAALIAAAPELLAALEMFLEDFDKPLSSIGIRIRVESVDKARAAIAAAKGEQS